MNWIIQYRVKGAPGFIYREINNSWMGKRDVQEWFMSVSKIYIDCIGSTVVGGFRYDTEFINCWQTK